MKQKIIISIMLVMLLMLTACSSGPLAISGTENPINLNERYPTFDDRLAVAKLGALDCTYTGGLTAYSTVTGFFSIGNGQYAKILECPSNAGSNGCEFKIDAPSCAPKTGLNCVAASTPKPYMRSGATASSLSTWTPYSTSTIKLTAGQSYRVELACADTLNNNILGACKPGFAETPGASFRESERKIRVTGECGYNGWLPGSSNCQLVSTELEKLKDMQPSNAPLSLSAGQIGFGQTQSFVACWDDLPVIGNINPLGQYNNKDVFCSPFDGLYEAKLTQTTGDKRYWMQGSKLLSRTTTNQFCCSNDQCGGSATCENYKCVEKPVTCGAAGSCNSWQNGDVIAKDKEVTRSGKFYLQTDTCVNGCIDRQEEQVKCTKEYCDKQSSPGNQLQCIYDQGCKAISVLQECPAGSCCDAGSIWKQQACSGGNVCCKTSTNSDAFIGTCQTTCVAEPLCTADSDCNTGQICNNGKCQAPICEDKLGGLIPGKIVTKNTDGIFSDKSVTSCEYDNTFMYVIGAVVVILFLAVLGAAFFFGGRKKRR